MISISMLLVIIIATVATFLPRYLGMILGNRMKISIRMKRGFRYVPIGVFSALTVSSIFDHADFEWEYVIAIIVTFFIAWFTKSTLWAMLSGTITIALLRLII